MACSSAILPDERRSYEFRGENFAPTDPDAFASLIGDSVSGAPVAVGFFAYTPKIKQVMRYQDGRRRPTHYNPPRSGEEVLGVVEPEPHPLFLTTPSGLWRQQEGREATLLTPSLWQPSALATDPRGELFVLSSCGRAPYRIDKHSGGVEWIDLIRGGLSDACVTKSSAAGFATSNGRTFYIDVGRWIVRVDTPASGWQPLSELPPAEYDLLRQTL
jgi:hypothetical protein